MFEILTQLPFFHIVAFVLSKFAPFMSTKAIITKIKMVKEGGFHIIIVKPTQSVIMLSECLGY